MIRTISRGLSLLVIAISLWFALPIEKVGSWRDGYRIDAHTPPVLIAIAGWVLLLLDACFIVSPDFLARLFGVV